MHKIYILVLFFTYIGICIDCQGGRGSSHRSSSRSYSSHSSHHHHHGSGGGGGANFAIALVVLFFIGMAIYILYEFCIKNESIKSNAGFVDSTNSQSIIEDANLFHSGLWYSDYKQDDQWHGPFEMSITFNPDSLEVNGSGCDDVGLYSVTGTYSHQTRRIGLTKSYRAGTGDVSQNLGHDVIIQLAHTQNTQQFEGKWYVRTSEYSGENEFILKRKPEHGQVNNGYVKSENWV